MTNTVTLPLQDIRDIQDVRDIRDIWDIATGIIEDTAGEYAKQAGNPANTDWAMPLCHALALELNRRRVFDAHTRARRTSRLIRDLPWLVGENYRNVHAELVRRGAR